MNSPESNTPAVSYLLEHSHGTCELWIRQTEHEDFLSYEPVRLLRVSGRGTVLLRTEMITEAIMLEEWMADHFEIFAEGRTSYD